MCSRHNVPYTFSVLSRVTQVRKFRGWNWHYFGWKWICQSLFGGKPRELMMKLCQFQRNLNTCHTRFVVLPEQCQILVATEKKINTIGAKIPNRWSLEQHKSKSNMNFTHVDEEHVTREAMVTRVFVSLKIRRHYIVIFESNADFFMIFRTKYFAHVPLTCVNGLVFN